MFMEWLRKAPTPLVVTMLITMALASIAYLGGYVYLTANGIDTTDYRTLLNTAFNYAGILLGSVTTVASVAAAKSSSKTEQQTNGNLTALQAEVKQLRALLVEKDGTGV